MAARRAAYELVAQRQLHYNNLLWQVPAISLTAQAFLFTIALSAEVTAASRFTASGLALVMALTSMHLMSRHRQADVADSHWLEDQSAEAIGGIAIHGRAFKLRRDRHPAGGPLARLSWAYGVWMIALGLFVLAAIFVIVGTAINPGLFSR